MNKEISILKLTNILPSWPAELMADSFWETIVTLILALLAALLCVGLGVCLLFPWGLSSSLSRPSIWSLVTGTEPQRQNILMRWSNLVIAFTISSGFLLRKKLPTFQMFFVTILNEQYAHSPCERCSEHLDFEANTHKLRAMGTRKEVRKKEEREKKDRHLPNIQGGVPGERFFLTSMFCFIKAANWAEMSREGKARRKVGGRQERGWEESISVTSHLAPSDVVTWVWSYLEMCMQMLPFDKLTKHFV